MKSERLGGDKITGIDRFRHWWAEQLEPRLLPSHPEQLIAYSRLALAVFSLVAVYLDPTQPSRFSDVAYSLLAAYAFYSVIQVALSHLSIVEALWNWPLHAIELIVLATLVFLTDGPTSPFFIFFTFAIVSAALRWSTAGAFTTSFVLLLLFLGASLVQPHTSPDEELNRLIMRSSYLLIVSVLLGYFGAYRHRSRDRLERLASWPAPQDGTEGSAALEVSLAHAASTLKAQGILVVWDSGESGPRTAHLGNGTFALAPLEEVDCTHVVDETLGELTFMAVEASGKTAVLPSGRQSLNAALVCPHLVQTFQIGSFSTAAFRTAHTFGRVFVLGPDALTGELLSLTEIVAGRIGVEFEHSWLRSHIAMTAAAQERVRLARDVHDGVLQNLTAAGLQLKMMSDLAAPDIRPAYAEVMALVSGQQKRLREFITAVNPKPNDRHKIALAGALEQVAAELARQWQCRIVWDNEPEGLVLDQNRFLQLQLLIAEAVANAVRHGGATEIEISVAHTDALKITVRDNGMVRFFRSKNGARVVTPFSLTQRVKDLGGTCHLQADDQGSELSLILPGGQQI